MTVQFLDWNFQTRVKRKKIVFDFYIDFDCREKKCIILSCKHTHNRVFREEQPQTERRWGGGRGGREGGGGREGVANWSSHQSEAGDANACGTSLVSLNTK